jgi:hypothetical protein
VVPLLLIVLTPSIPRPVGACSLAPRDGGWHNNDPLYALDTTPPSAVTASYTVLRAKDDGGGGGGCGIASCGPAPSYVLLSLSATDDRAAVDRLGYTFAIVDGQPPRYFNYENVLKVDPYSASGTELGLSFDTDAAPFSFDLEIRAVDLNGNEGPPIVMTIEG